MKITIEAVVATTPERVWACWTEPEHIVHWNFASDDWCCPNAENDLRVGGRYRARMEAKDGSFGFDFEAIYDEVSAPHALTYTMDDDRKVMTRFEKQGGSTRVRQTFDAEESNSIEMQRDGWQAILDNFKAYVERAESAQA
ncbi:MAG: SRPBCC family protein [Myxococcota bacterium]